MNGIILFELKREETFSEKLNELKETGLESLFEDGIFEQGYDYYINNQIESVQFQTGQVIARILGIKLYETSIVQEEGQVSSSCDCPTNGACKHLAALMIHLSSDATEEELNELNVQAGVIDQQAFENYINNLSLAELKELVIKFAPESFRESVLIS